MSIKYERAYIDQDKEYLYKVMQAHADYVHPGSLPKEVKLNPELISELESKLMYYSIKAVKNNEIVGLISGPVYRHFQYQDHIFAEAIILQVNKDLSRREKIGIIKGLTHYFERVGKQDYNASYIQIDLSASRDIRKLFHKFGYADTEYIVTKKLQ